MQFKKMSCPSKKFELYKIVGLSLNIVFALLPLLYFIKWFC